MTSFVDFVVARQVLPSGARTSVAWIGQCVSLQSSRDFSVYLDGKFAARSVRGHVNWAEVFSDMCTDDAVKLSVPMHARTPQSAIDFSKFDTIEVEPSDELPMALDRVWSIVGVFVNVLVRRNVGLGVRFGGATPARASDLDFGAYGDESDDDQRCLPEIQRLAAKVH